MPDRDGSIHFVVLFEEADFDIDNLYIIFDFSSQPRFQQPTRMTVGKDPLYYSTESFHQLCPVLTTGTTMSLKVHHPNFWKYD